MRELSPLEITSSHPCTAKNRDPDCGGTRRETLAVETWPLSLFFSWSARSQRHDSTSCLPTIQICGEMEEEIVYKKYRESDREGDS